MCDTLITWLDNHSGTVQGLTGIATVFLAIATLSNKQSLKQLIRQNTLYTEEIKFQREQGYRLVTPYLMGVVHDPKEEKLRLIRVKNIGANAINFKYENLNSNKISVNIGHDVLTGNTEQDVVIRFDKVEDFDDIVFDFVCSGIDGLMVTQRFYKIKGYPGIIAPSKEYVDKFGIENSQISEIIKEAKNRNIQ